MRQKRQQGVALVITLILLAVITFTAITFLVLSRREKGAVATSTDQTIAKLAAETGVERLQGEILATILAETNEFAYGLKVTTNYLNPLGFVSGDFSLTNVNYSYQNGNPLSSADQEQNVGNLFYNPRPPVYIVTNRALPGNTDFRFYLDLNRNGRFDPNGPQPVVGQNGFYVDTNGIETTVSSITDPPPVGTLTNFMVGDPEWIGILERPDEPHSPSNRFVARYATVVVPSGKTLDLNRVHNQVLPPGGQDIGYRRNMGVGTWEPNLAAFLVDLNTNYWTAPDDLIGISPYIYRPLDLVPVVSGVAFEDANSLLQFRYNTDFGRLRPLRSVQQLFSAPGNTDFLNDRIDGYSAGGIGGAGFLTNIWLPVLDPDSGLTGNPWPGDESPRKFETIGDLFDVRKVGAGFANRLLSAGRDLSTYDRYTYYRLLSQMGTDGVREDRGKINLNYDNRTRYFNGLPDPNGVASVTNFVPWRPVDFFVNAADKMLREYHGGTFRRVLDQRYGAGFTAANNLALNIPVMTNGVLIHTPSVHRILQMAANMYDASITNRVDRLVKGSTNVFLPTVFKPLLRRDGDDVYICNWTNITSFTRDDENRGTLDLDIKAQRDLIPVLPPNPVQGSEFNAYNVPWVIGAKKGLPNFNEMSLQSVFEITRKLQIDKRLRSTNQLLFVGVSNAVAVEAWNSYTNWFPLGVNIVARNDMEVGLAISNRFQSSVNGMFGSSRVYATAATNLIQAWEGRGAVNNPNRVAFQVPIYTNFASFVPAVFTKNGLMQTNLNRGWLDAASGGGGDLPVPVIRLYVTNRLQFYMLARNDAGVTNVIDYVHLRVVSERDISRELDEEGSNTERDLWDSNRAANAGDIPRGVLRQILVSLGTPGVPDFVWDNYGRLEAAGARTKEQAIANFMAFYYGRDATFRGYQGKFSSTNLVMQVPFSPTRRLLEYRTWQANDPLVHYMAGDLEYLEQGDGIRNLSPLERIPSLENENLRRLNDRYQPWGGNPSSAATRGGTTARNFKLELKDPGVRFSDDWEFPTNKFPNVGWLGRVHRGTPWQTIYMKANEIGQGRGGGSGREWREWTGNSSRRDAALTFPQQDFKLFDLFTAALSDNATAGQMSVNQDGLAAWSAILSGVIALTNTAPGESTPRIITPAGVDQPNSAVGRIVEGINSDRNREPKKAFERVGDVLKAEELSVRSPFLNLSDVQAQQAMTDALYERIPQQIMGSLRGSDKPRFVVYSYGQRLKPAERSLVTSGPLFGLCTNYQVTAEVAVRSVIQVDGAPNRPQVSVESFNLLPAD